MRASNAALNAASASFCAALGCSAPGTAPLASASFSVADSASTSARNASFKALRASSNCAFNSACPGADAAPPGAGVDVTGGSGKRRPSTSTMPSSWRSPLSVNVPLSVLPAWGPASSCAAKMKSRDCHSLLALLPSVPSEVLTDRMVALSLTCTDAGSVVPAGVSVLPPPHPNIIALARAIADHRKFGLARYGFIMISLSNSSDFKKSQGPDGLGGSATLPSTPALATNAAARGADVSSARGTSAHPAPPCSRCPRW
jgi:hypothetical protein